MHKVWIRAIRGFHSAKRGPALQLHNNPRIADTILGFSCAITAACKVCIYIIYGYSSRATQTDTKVANAILDKDYYGGCQID